MPHQETEQRPNAFENTMDSKSRILVVDDNEQIHSDFQKILAPQSSTSSELAALEEALFEKPTSNVPDLSFKIDSAYQGKEALGLVRQAIQENQPYAVAFIDVRMPPGWDGIETTSEIWKVDPDIQIVICTAYSDYSWEQMISILGQSDRLLILKKPFNTIEVRQLASALTEKWYAIRSNRILLHGLESQVKLRTRDLQNANEQLRHEMEERLRAERSLRRTQKLEALGRLTGGISHEINNPLSYVLANLDFCQVELTKLKEQWREIDVDELCEVIQEAIEGGERIKKIIQDVQAFSRYEEGDTTEVDVVSTMQGAVKLLHNQLHHQVQLVTDFQEVPLVMADRWRLEQVFVNLIVNALKAMEQDNPNKEIRLTIQTRQDGNVVVEVCDNGVGIPEEVMSRIFDPFFTTRDVGEGTGLGLSICRTIINGFQGEIELINNANKGVSAVVTLLRAQESERKVGAEQGLVEGKDFEEMEKQSAKASILIVDDEENVGRALKRLLSGYDTQVSTDAKEALDLYKHDHFDLVLCDLMMPGMNGMDLFHELEKLGSDHADRMVFATGGAFTPAAENFLKSIPNPWLQKPFAKDKTIDLIETRLSSLRAS
ncbi:MAG: response regulator [Myxococcales bacterium]|nr:MAG: response regulator [Myxococcales bacterium]